MCLGWGGCGCIGVMALRWSRGACVRVDVISGYQVSSLYQTSMHELHDECAA